MFGAVASASSYVFSPVTGYASQWARNLVLATLEKGITVGQLIIEDTVSREMLTFGKPGGLRATMIVLDEAMWWRVFTRSSLGFSESYMLGEVECSDLIDFLKITIVNRDDTDDMSSILSSYMFHVANWFKPSNDVVTSLENVKAHYDLSNDVFAAFLSSDMTYSQETDHVLDIGGGWASFAIEAVRATGCRVTARTLSQEQKREADARAAAAGLEKNITFLLKDYREFEEETRRGGQRTVVFDKIVSIEMLEHVGKEHLASFFSVVDKLLKKEGGVAVIQCCTMAETLYDAYSKATSTFINQYIFPGGHLPSTTQIVLAANQGSKGALIPDRFNNVGEHYGRTLQTWRENFLSSFESHIVPALRKKNQCTTDQEIAIFRRKWVFYFSYCEAGFRLKMLGDCKIKFVREV